MLKRIGRVDFIFFDNIMSLIAGDMKEEEGWRQALPWIKSLTKRAIGQVWMHHTATSHPRLRHQDARMADGCCRPSRKARSA